MIRRRHFLVVKQTRFRLGGAWCAAGFASPRAQAGGRRRRGAAGWRGVGPRARASGDEHACAASPDTCGSDHSTRRVRGVIGGQRRGPTARKEGGTPGRGRMLMRHRQDLDSDLPRFSHRISAVRTASGGPACRWCPVPTPHTVCPTRRPYISVALRAAPITVFGRLELEAGTGVL